MMFAKAEFDADMDGKDSPGAAGDGTSFKAEYYAQPASNTGLHRTTVRQATECVAVALNVLESGRGRARSDTSATSTSSTAGRRFSGTPTHHRTATLPEALQKASEQCDVKGWRVDY